MDKNNVLKLKLGKICEQLIDFTKGCTGCKIDIPLRFYRNEHSKLPLIEIGSFVEKPIDEMFVVVHNSITHSVFTYFDDHIGHGSSCGSAEEEFGISVKENESDFRILCLFDSKFNPEDFLFEISGDTAILFNSEEYIDEKKVWLPVFTVTLIH